MKSKISGFSALVVIPKSRKFAIFVPFRGCSKNNEIKDFWFFGIGGH